MKRLVLLLVLLMPFSSLLIASTVSTEESLLEDMDRQEELVERGIVRDLQEKFRPYPTYPLFHYRVREVLQLVESREESSYDALGNLNGAILLMPGVYIRLIDNSLWQVAPSDESTAIQLRPKHILSVNLNSGWSADSDFFNIFWHENRGDTLQVRLIIPGDSSLNTRSMDLIKQISYDALEIELDHGTCWQIGAEDFARIASYWEQSDVIVIGVNRGLFSTMPNILMNLSKGNSCPAGWCP